MTERPDALDELLDGSELSAEDRAAVNEHADRLAADDARTLPPHTHLDLYPAVAGCPRCMRLGAINPDTGTPWPDLDDHGEQVVEEASGRFHDRYDGGNHEAALAQAVTEAYQRGRMRGRQDEREEAHRRAQARERAAEDTLRTALALVGQPGAHSVIARELSEAAQHMAIAAGLRITAGQQR